MLIIAYSSNHVSSDGWITFAGYLINTIDLVTSIEAAVKRYESSNMVIFSSNFDFSMSFLIARFIYVSNERCNVDI